LIEGGFGGFLDVGAEGLELLDVGGLGRGHFGFLVGGEADSIRLAWEG
jgi:hypothetical protein